MKIKLVKCTLFPFIFLLYIYCTPVLINAQNLESYISKLTGDPIKYAIYYPKDYLKTKKYPMLVYLHGMDEKGWPVGGFNPTIRKTGLPLLIESGLK